MHQGDEDLLENVRWRHAGDCGNAYEPTSSGLPLVNAERYTKSVQTIYDLDDPLLVYHPRERISWQMRDSIHDSEIDNPLLRLKIPSHPRN